MAKNTAGVVLECVNPHCAQRYSPISGVMRYCALCGEPLKVAEKRHRPAEKPGQ